MFGKTIQYNTEPYNPDLTPTEESITRLCPAIVYTYDVGIKQIHYLNDKLKEVLGYDYNELAGGDFRNIVFAEDAEKVKLEMEKFYALKDNESYCYQCRLNHKNKTQRYFKTTGSVLKRDDKGNVSSLLFVAQDITELVLQENPGKQEIKARERKYDLKRINNDFEEFSNATAEGLKEPLKRIYAISEKLRSRFADTDMEDVKEYLGQISSSAGNIQSHINNLLEFSKISDTATLPYEFCSLNYLLEEVKTGMLLKLIETKTTIHHDRLPRAQVISSQFRQLLYQLFSNAIKFQRRDAIPEIRVRYEFLDAGEKEKLNLPATRLYYKIIVKDNGIGFTRDASDKIFNPFYRLHNKTEYPGTGAGLFICKKIIENHHGFISADSEPGLGAIFTIILPEKQ